MWLHHFAFPPAVQEMANFSPSLIQSDGFAYSGPSGCESMTTGWTEITISTFPCSWWLSLTGKPTVHTPAVQALCDSPPTPPLLPHFPPHPLWFNMLRWSLTLQLLVFLGCVSSRCSRRWLLPHLGASLISFSLEFCSPYYPALLIAISSWFSTPSECLNFNFMFSCSPPQKTHHLSLSSPPPALPHSLLSFLSLCLSPLSPFIPPSLPLSHSHSHSGG